MEGVIYACQPQGSMVPGVSLPSLSLSLHPGGCACSLRACTCPRYTEGPAFPELPVLEGWGPGGSQAGRAGSLSSSLVSCPQPCWGPAG